MSTSDDAAVQHVFISYSHLDAERASHIAHVLEDVGVRVWIDRGSIVGGQRWSAAIARGIRDCAAVLVLCSEASLRSRNVQQELQLAWEYARPILPLILEMTHYPLEVEYALAGQQWIEVLGYPDDDWLPETLWALADLGVAHHGHARPPRPRRSMPTGALAAPPGNLPQPITSFVGRDVELEELQRLVASGRLVTLSGPGGTGKTRLAIEVSRVLSGDFSGGTFFVRLLAIDDPNDLMTEIARTLGVREVQGRALIESVKAHIRDRAILLVLDNFEQVVSAAPQVIELLEACPRLTVLVTSRFRLHLRGEREFLVPPLARPDLAGSIPLSSLTENASVQLFVERARDVRPDFTLTTENAAVVAAICDRLDGLPLAIELAAARIRMLSPQAILARLEKPLEVLTGGPRDAPAHQQALRSTIAWSYALLVPAEQAIFRRLSVFASECTLEAIEAVCCGAGDLDVDAFDAAASLVDKSFLRLIATASGEPRLAMFQTIREFGLEELRRANELEAMRRRHAGYFLALAEQSEPVLRSGARDEWMQRLTDEQDNLRAALRWSVEVEEAPVGMRILAALWVWYWHEAMGEGRRWGEELLAMPSAATPDDVRARALLTTASLAMALGDFVPAMPLLTASVEISRTTGRSRDLAEALAWLGILMVQDPPVGHGMLEESQRLARASGDSWTLALATGMRGILCTQTGEADRARALLEECAAMHRARGDVWGESVMLLYLGLLAIQQSDLAQARDVFEQCLPYLIRERDRRNLAIVYTSLGGFALQAAEHARAAAYLREGLALGWEVGDTGTIPTCLVGLAHAAVAHGEAERAATLLGAAQAAQQPGSAAVLPTSDPLFQGTTDAIRAALSETEFASAWARGQQLSIATAISYALASSEVDAIAG